MWTQQTNFFLLATVSYVSAAADGQIRLAGSGSTRCSGRVEIYHRGSWGTICDDDWDLKDAEVVCRQLNCGTALSATTDAHFGEGTGPIWLHYLVCAGTETSLRKCDHGGFRQQDCGHHEDAGVICLGVRLAGSTLCSGRVEIYHRNSWRTVSDDGWDFTDAQVLCNELDCGTPVNVTHFGEGSGEIWFDNVTCSGNETSLTECRRSEIKSSRLHKHAGVICSVPLQQPSISLTSPNGGLVWGPEGAEITKGSSFVFSCSINSRYTPGCFRLFFSGVNLTEPAVNHSASFSFPAAEYEHQGSYSCVYELLLPSRTFTSAESAPIHLIITFPWWLLVLSAVPGILVLLLVLLVVCLVLWRRRRARRFDPNVLMQSCQSFQTSKTHGSLLISCHIHKAVTTRYGCDGIGEEEDEEEEKHYVNVEHVETENKYAEQAEGVEEEVTDADYEEIQDKDKSCDDENNYVHVIEACAEEAVDVYGGEQIYQNF